MKKIKDVLFNGLGVITTISAFFMAMTGVNIITIGISDYPVFYQVILWIGTCVAMLATMGWISVTIYGMICDIAARRNKKQIHITKAEDKGRKLSDILNDMDDKDE